MTPFPRNYGLDVTRAIAILMVLLIHSINGIFQSLPPLSWYVSLGGVELFFSLSGFLIGTILLKMFREGSITLNQLRRFWIRRWLRTVPMYMFLLTLYFVLVNVFIKNIPFDFSYYVYMQNLVTHRTFFPETWSISIEEWFYLLLPACAAIITLLPPAITKLIKNVNPVLCATMISIIAMIILRQLFSSRQNYHYGVLFRLDATSYGILAAHFSSFCSALSNKKALMIILIGLSSWVLAVGLHGHNFSPLVKTFYYPLCGAGTALVVSGMYYYKFGKQSRTIVFISKISYSIYLVNYTGIFYPMETVTPYLSRLQQCGFWLLAMLLIFSVSWLTYLFIEQPFLRLKENV